MGDFNVKLGMKNGGETSVGHFVICMSKRRDQLIELPERNRLKIMTIFLQKRKHVKNENGKAAIER